jgi:hypothetical protein
MDPNTLMSILILPVGGWLVKEVLELRSIKTDVPHIRERVDRLYDHLIGREEK